MNEKQGEASADYWKGYRAGQLKRQRGLAHDAVLETIIAEYEDGDEPETYTRGWHSGRYALARELMGVGVEQERDGFSEEDYRYPLENEGHTLEGVAVSEHTYEMFRMVSKHFGDGDAMVQDVCTEILDAYLFYSRDEFVQFLTETAARSSWREGMEIGE